MVWCTWRTCLYHTGASASTYIYSTAAFVLLCSSCEYVQTIAPPYESREYRQNLLPTLQYRRIAPFEAHCRVTCPFQSMTYSFRTLSLRNLILGYECGRVFPAGLGLDSPSRDATNSVSSRFSRSIETPRRFGWLRIVLTRCASSELQFGALREVVARERQRALSQKVL